MKSNAWILARQHQLGAEALEPGWVGA